jgi:hypothetical protein
MSTGGTQELFGPAGVGPGNQDQVDALRTVLGLGGGALALGAGVRGLSSLSGFLSRNLGGPARTPQRQSFVRIPVPVKVRTPAERDALLAAAEEEKEAGFAKLAEDALTWASRNMANAGGLLRHPGQEENLLQSQFGGWGNPGFFQKPWAVPAAAAAIGGGLYGGWKLTDYLLGKTRTAEQESELEEARKEYEGALAGRRKLASAAAGPEPLDALADLYEKQALWPEAKGLGLLLGGGLLLGSGVGGYNWARSLSAEKAIEEAVKRRQAQIAEQAPSPIMAIPTPVPVMSPRRLRLPQLGRRLGLHSEEDKEEKAANVGQAADEFLNRIKSNQMAVWNRLMTPADAKPKPPAKPAEPPPPQLPSLVRSLGQTAGQPAAQSRSA